MKFHLQKVLLGVLLINLSQLYLRGNLVSGRKHKRSPNAPRCVGMFCIGSELKIQLDNFALSQK